jgi:GT2 family glycosyltransferase
LLSISIVSHGDAANVRALLSSLAAHEDASRLQLLLTANLGDDLPEVDPARWHSMHLSRNDRPRGFASNHNAAFRRAEAEFFCLLNPDVLLLEPVFEKLIARLRAGEADILAPLAVDGEGRVQDSFRALPTPMELIRRRALGKDAPDALPAGAILELPLQKTDWLAGFFLMMRSSLYAGLGGMDERFRLYLEDVDLCTRARLKGCAVRLDPSMRFRHDARRASRADPRFFLWHLSSAARFFLSPVYREARSLRKSDSRTGNLRRGDS